MFNIQRIAPVLAASLLISISSTTAQPTMTASSRSLDSAAIHQLFDSALALGQAYPMLRELITTIGSRLSGSPEAARAVEWGRRMMIEHGLEKVHLQEVLVPHWVRGKQEELRLIAPSMTLDAPLRISTLGGSVATPEKGNEAEVIEVRSLDEARALGEASCESNREKLLLYGTAKWLLIANPQPQFGRKKVHEFIAVLRDHLRYYQIPLKEVSHSLPDLYPFKNCRVR